MCFDYNVLTISLNDEQMNVLLPHHPGHDLLQASVPPSSYKTGSKSSEVHLKTQTAERETQKMTFHVHNDMWQLGYSVVKLLTFIQRLCQLCSHTAIRRIVGLQRDGHKQRGVRRFGRRAAGWGMSAGIHRASRVLFMQQNRGRRLGTAACGDASSPGVNVTLKPRKQTQTPVYWHPSIPGVSALLWTTKKPVLLSLHIVQQGKYVA